MLFRFQFQDLDRNIIAIGIDDLSHLQPNK